MIYIPHKSVQLPFGKDNMYFHQLFYAILQVSEDYIKYEVEFGEGRKGYNRHLERIFAYELYRRWGNIIEADKEDLMLNAEIDKVININSILIETEEVQTPLKTEEIKLYPDIVLHHSQGDVNKQIIICEIKRNHQLTGSKIFGDMYKTSCYMTKGIFGEGKEPYKYGVFLIVGSGLSIIRDRVKCNTEININDCRKVEFKDFIKDQILSPSFDRIVCVAYDGTNLEYNTLNKLTDDILTQE